MNFCSVCGERVVHKVPPGDSLPRYCCDACGTIHYQNPRVIVGTLPVWQGKILLCQRAIEPQYGKWTLPAGFMENGETMAQGALRETIEETAALVDMGALFAVIDIAHVNQVHVFYQANLIAPNFSATSESLNVALFAPTEIPWDLLAFRSVKRVLAFYCQTLASQASFEPNRCFTASIEPIDSIY